MERKDFARITKDIEDLVEKAGQRIKEEYEAERRRSRVKPPRRKRKSTEEMKFQFTGFFQKFHKKQNDNQTYNEADVFVLKPKGRFVGSFLLLSGICFSVFTGVAGLFHIYTSLAYGGYVFSNGAQKLAMLLLFGLGIFMMVRGNAIKGRLERFRMYKRRLLGKEYCQLELLGKTTGKSIRYLKKDLKKMIELGLFRQGHLDEQGTCLILTDRAYQQYMLMMESQIRQKEEAKKAAIQKEEEDRRKEEIKNQRFADVEEDLREEIKKIVRDGEVYLDRFQAVNDRLTGEEITKKLSRLSAVTGRIFEFIMEHPKKLGDIRKFMSYYLPTTEKLLATYEELDRELVQGENIIKAKKEIEDTLDTINFAFENLLDSLYEDTMMDISTDIAVLETMLAQEGLTEQDF